MNSGALKIAISAGEPSGDEHAALVAKALKNFSPGVSIRGMGGTALRAQAVETVVDSETSASVMGFHEVVLALPKILKALKEMKKLLSSWQPDLLILVDYPDFNFQLAKAAKKLNIPVLFFIPPTVWAWRSSRVNLLKEYVTKTALIYPFERKFLEEHGYKNSVYVGHPLAAEWQEFKAPDRIEFLKSQNFNPENPILALFPGSRSKEISAHFVPLMQSLQLLDNVIPDLQVLVAAASGVSSAALCKEIPEGLKVKVLTGKAKEILSVSDAALLKSGTSQLQGAFSGTPFSMFYVIPKLTEIIVKMLASRDYYSMVNIIRPDTVSELLQGDVNPERLSFEVSQLLNDEDYRTKIRIGLTEVSRELSSYDKHPIFEGTKNVGERVAKLALDTIATLSTTEVEVPQSGQFASQSVGA